jgi:predicted phosphodiesterase
LSLGELHSEQEKAFLEAFNIPFPYIPPIPDYAKTINPRKILVLPDPHEPYSAEYAWKHALENHHDAAMVVIPGDLGDFYSKSRFRKPKAGNFRDEVKAVFTRMEWLSQNWPQVKIMLGNHDNRPEKKIRDLLQVDPELLILTEARLLHHMAAYFPNIEVVQHQVVNTSIGLTYLWQYGDMVFAHAEISRAQSSATLEYISSWLHRWSHLAKLNPYKLIVQAHNHQSDKKDVDGETWMLVPTMSDPYSMGMEYVWDGRLYRHPPVVGYAILHHDEGKVSTNECMNIVLRMQ